MFNSIILSITRKTSILKTHTKNSIQIHNKRKKCKVNTKKQQQNKYKKKKNKKKANNENLMLKQYVYVK